jgi:hypothetical protein
MPVILETIGVERFLRDKSGEVTGILYTHTASKHFDEQLIAIEEILGDELHWGSRRSVVEARDDDIGRFVKSGTGRQLLRALPFNLQNRRAFRNVPNYRAGMLMAAGLLIGLKRNLANINGGYLPLGKSCLQKWLAENRSLGHVSLMSRNGEGRNPDSEAQF